MEKIFPLGSPDIREEDIECVVNILRTGMLVQGKYVEELENQLAEYLGVKHVVAVTNGTSTMYLTLLAMGIGIGDEVIVPALSYIATANVVEMVGATPVFVDVEEYTFNIDADLIEAAITSRTRGIIPVHEFGLASDMNTILKIAKKNKLWVMEDAACALGAEYNGQKVGTFGLCSSFSLHPRKAITSGEGGFIATDDTKLADALRMMRNHGAKITDGKTEFLTFGLNFRMTEFQAALVNSQFKRFSKILDAKNELANAYFKYLDTKNLILPYIPSNRKHTWQTFHILLKKEGLQSDFISYLRERKIGTNYGAQCIPAQINYQKKYNLNSQTLFPNAWKAYTCGVALPIYEKLNIEDIRYISNTINQF